MSRRRARRPREGLRVSSTVQSRRGRYFQLEPRRNRGVTHAVTIPLLPEEAHAPFFYDWPCSLENDISGNFIVTPFYLEHCTRIASTRDAAEAAARKCIRAFVVGERDGTAPELLSIPPDTISGRVIYVRVDVMSSGPVNVMSSGPSEAVF